MIKGKLNYKLKETKKGKKESATQAVFFWFTFFSVALRPSAGHGLLYLAVSRSHTTTHYSR
jgi:hypothetical protein